MFQLFKPRDFGELFNDTFSFFKIKGKNYFANYFKIAAVFLLLTTITAFIFGRFYYETIFSGISNPYGNDEYIENFVNDNIGWIGIGGFIMFIILMISSLVITVFPVFYLKTLENDPGYRPTANEIGRLIRQNFGKILLFGILSFFVIGILGTILLAINMALVFIVIGIFAFFITIPFISSLFYLTLFRNMNHQESYFDSLGFAYNTIMNNFWKIIGCNLILMFLVQLVTSIISMIPYFIFFVGMFTSETALENSDQFASGMFLAVGMLYGVSILVSMLLNNLIVINFGLVYYSEREKTENRSVRNELEQIGLDPDA